MAERIDIEREAQDFMGDFEDCFSPSHRATMEAQIIAFGKRVRESQREEDAKKCDAIIAENEKRRSNEPAKERRNKIGKVVYGATLCAAAIRNGRTTK